jgi:hypothetical protein
LQQGAWRPSDEPTKTKPQSGTTPRSPVARTGGSDGYTESIMLAHGFTISMLGRLVLDGLVTATPDTVLAGSRPIKIVRVQITDAGRRALAG